MVEGQIFLKGGGWHFSYLIFSNFIILHLEIILSFPKLRYTLHYVTIIL